MSLKKTKKVETIVIPKLKLAINSAIGFLLKLDLNIEDVVSIYINIPFLKFSFTFKTNKDSKTTDVKGFVFVNEWDLFPFKG